VKHGFDAILGGRGQNKMDGFEGGRGGGEKEHGVAIGPEQQLGNQQKTERKTANLREPPVATIF